MSQPMKFTASDAPSARLPWIAVSSTESSVCELTAISLVASMKAPLDAVTLRSRALTEPPSTNARTEPSTTFTDSVAAAPFALDSGIGVPDSFSDTERVRASRRASPAAATATSPGVVTDDVSIDACVARRRSLRDDAAASATSIVSGTASMSPDSAVSSELSRAVSVSPPAPSMRPAPVTSARVEPATALATSLAWASQAPSVSASSASADACTRAPSIVAWASSWASWRTRPTTSESIVLCTSPPLRALTTASPSCWIAAPPGASAIYARVSRDSVTSLRSCPNEKP